MSTPKTPLTYQYLFRFRNGKTQEFSVALNPDTLAIQEKPRATYPRWTALASCQCPNCPLDRRKTLHCPAAVSLIDLVAAFGSGVSFEEVEVTVRTEAREYRKQTSLQKGLSAFIGICMAASGCPILAKFRPMARFHLPFADLEETEYRVLSMYLLAQYFVAARGERPACEADPGSAGGFAEARAATARQRPDWKLTGLQHLYDEVKKVNAAFAERLRTVPMEDAHVNAVVILNTFADSVLFSLRKNILHRIERLFRPYFQPV